ncbi:NPF8.2, partial [Symbiodinium pilosum]
EFFLEKTGYSLAQANALTTAMSTLCMAWAVFAGWVADVQLGRFRTIIIFGVIYSIGGLAATAAAAPGLMSSGLYLFALLVLVPMGTAGIKSNISNFGADQYDMTDPEQVAAQEQFFQWFYMAINVGSAFAYGFLTTLGTNGGLGVSKEYGYFAAYFLASACMAVAAS